MKVTISRGCLSVDLYDLMGELDTEQRAKVIDALACREEVITEVANQIIDGFTSEGSHAPMGWGGNAEATYGIDGARMRIAKASSEISAREIEQMADKLRRTEARINEGWKAYHELLESRRFA